MGGGGKRAGGGVLGDGATTPKISSIPRSTLLGALMRMLKCWDYV